MGLDMYAYAVREKPAKDVDFDTPKEIEDTWEGIAKNDYRLTEGQEPWFHYWRKHPDAHGWFAKLYVEKGGKEPEDNFAGPVVLTLEDINRFETAVLRNRLPHTEGFFFGRSYASDKDDDLAFISKARAKIAEGFTVYYTSSW